MQQVTRRLLFWLPPERAKLLALLLLRCFYLFSYTLSKFSPKLSSRLTTYFFPTIPASPRTVMNINFPNLLGLAAGFDKDADYIDPLSLLGFGFIEIGTVTPKPQTGNAKPRIFRNVAEQAVINRMGFNNKGMAYVAKRLKKTKYKGILGINIGKNGTTPNEKAIDDYLACFNHLVEYASYITINISSPNTKNLRDLQQRESLVPLLQALKSERDKYLESQQRYVPIAVKISPDLSKDELYDLATILLEEKIDAVIATNTTVSRDDIAVSAFSNELGGLSGTPLCQRSTEVIKELFLLLKGAIPIIASGGVANHTAIQEKLDAGAELVQVYTGLVYQGPDLLQAPIN